MSSLIATEEFRDILNRTLRDAKEPLSANQVRTLLTGPAKRPKEEVEAALQDMVQAEEAFQYPKFNRNHRYWNRPRADYIDREILRMLVDQPRSKTKIREAFKKKLNDVKSSEIEQHVDDLVRQGKLQKWPYQIGARTFFFCARKIEPDFYVEHALGKVIEKLKIAGIGKSDLRSVAKSITAGWSEAKPPEPSLEAPEAAVVVEPIETTTEPSLEELILERMSVVEPRAEEGGLVSITALWNNLEFQQIPKRDFDEAILKLRREWRVSLDEHPHTASLSPEELDKLVHDGQGHYFNGIAIREKDTL